MRILWLKTELLHPVDKGGKIRTYHMLREMKRAGQRITYLTLDENDDSDTQAQGRRRRAQAMEYCDELICIPHRTRAKFSAGFYVELATGIVSSLPYFMKKYASEAMRRAITEQAREGEIDVLVCDFLMPSINIPHEIEYPTLLFQHNVEAMIWRRHYEVQTHPLKKAYLYGEWLKTRAYERAACRRFDAVVAVSRDDAQMIEREYALGSVADVPTGVDTEFFRPQGNQKRATHNLVFTGSMDWLPNEDAMRYFTEQVLPLIKARIPDATLTIVGRHPSQALRELSARDPSIEVTGRVEDVRPYIERAAAFIVPIRIGGGTRLKIYEAMAMEKPVISTSIGAEGLPVREGAELLIADTPENFAASVVRVLMDETSALALGARAAATVREKFSWRQVAADFVAICERAVAMRQASAREPDMEFKKAITL